MSEYKNQHFLAQSYLKGFSAKCITKTPVIWVANLEKKEIRLKSIKKTASRSYLYSFQYQNGTYDHRMEHEFSRLERFYPDVIERIKKSISNILSAKPGNSLPARDRMVLCDYLFMNFVRIPKIMEWMIRESEKHNERMRKKGFKDTVESSVENLSVMGLHSIWTGDGRKEALEILTRKETTISFPTKRVPPIITCDNPVIRFNESGNNGLIYDDTRIVFPLFSRAYLSLYNYGNNLLYEQIHDMSQVDRFNHAIAANAVHEVYGSDPDTILSCFADFDDWHIIKPSIS